MWVLAEHDDESVASRRYLDLNGFTCTQAGTSAEPEPDQANTLQALTP